MAMRGVDFKWSLSLSPSLPCSFLSSHSALDSVPTACLQVRWLLPLHARHQRVSFPDFLPPSSPTHYFAGAQPLLLHPSVYKILLFPFLNGWGGLPIRIIVSINWKRYRLCAHPLHIWIVVDYTTVFIFRLLMFVDDGLAAGMGLDLGWQQRYARFCGRIVVLSVLVLLLYPFLWVWTVIGTLWFSTARGCLPEEGQKWGFLIWLLFSYCGLACIACVAVGKWLNRRHALQQRAQQGIPVSEYGVLVDMIRVPDWAFEAVGLEMRGMGQDTAYHPGLYLTAAQREAVEALIQELPKFRLKAVPTDCSECPICLEEFHVGNEVRGLPCAHNFHVECIDQWLRLNVKCPRCRCSVFPNLDLSALNNLRPTTEPDGPSASEVTTAATRYVRSQPAGQSYLLRLQGLLLRAVVRHEGDDAARESGLLHTVVSHETANGGSVNPELPNIVVDDGRQLPDR